MGSTVVGKGNRILNDGTYAFLYDGNRNLTRRTTLVSGAPTGAYVQDSWDHRNQLTKKQNRGAIHHNVVITRFRSV